MRTTLLLLAAMFCITLGSNAQTKKDGTPDMRYKANKEIYGTSNTSSPTIYTTPTITTPIYTAPKEKTYENGGQLKVQDGYLKSNGTYVAPHLKTTADDTKLNNLNPPK